MLVIRMQRTGRRGRANFRLVVQDSRQTPTSGRYVALVGNFDPHSKQLTVVKDQVEFYLKNGAQPSPRLATLLKGEGIKLPDWLEAAPKKAKAIRHPDKLRKNRPAGAPAPVKEEVEEASEGETVPETSAEAPAEAAAIEVTAEPMADKPAETTEDEPAADVSNEAQTPAVEPTTTSEAPAEEAEPAAEAESK